jgi:undecaprenyl-diphosphatase
LDILDSIILGVVEGITEFLPVSSTAHLVLTSQLLNLEQDEFMKSFEIVIQMAPIFSVILIFWSRLFNSKDIWIKLFIAFAPTGIMGLLLYSFISSMFSIVATVTWMVIMGIIFLLFEIFHSDNRYKLESEFEMTYTQAFYVGLFQALSLIPGVSRSGITILGGIWIGLSKELAMRFSFLLAIPTIGIATLFTIFKSEAILFENWELLGIGFLISFIFGTLAIKTFLHIVSKYGFLPFGIYLLLASFLFLAIGTA